MLEYQKAPYLELNNYKAPKGISSIFVSMEDGKRIRLAFWKNPSERDSCKGTILLQQGHNEFIEKYYETIQEFIDRGFCVVCFDWRGQGMSERMIDDKRKQFIKDFNIHDLDLSFIIERIIKPNLPKPLIGIGHSMGGCIILSSLVNHDQDFKAVILSAPMLGFKNERLLNILIKLSSFFRKGDEFLIGSKPNYGKETSFENNDLTTDPLRYKRTQNLVKLLPEIRLWGVTNTWAKAVLKRLLYIRKNKWLENIKTKVLIINNLEDKVVDPIKISEISSRIKNCDVLKFEKCKHEIFMEKDEHLAVVWKKIDSFLKNAIS